jgi:hypothetical protein
MRFTERVSVEGRFGVIYRRHAAKAARMVRDNRAEPITEAGRVDRIVLPPSPKATPFPTRKQTSLATSTWGDTFNTGKRKTQGLGLGEWSYDSRSCRYEPGLGWEHKFIHPDDRPIYDNVLLEFVNGLPQV